MTHLHSHLDRTIFLVKTTTLATSLYILLCKMLDDNVPPTLAQIRNTWSGTEQELSEAVLELVNQGILVPTDFSNEEKRWWLYPSTHWFPPGQPLSSLNLGKEERESPSQLNRL